MSDEPVKGELVPRAEYEALELRRQRTAEQRRELQARMAGQLEQVKTDRRKRLEAEEALRALANSVRLVLSDKARLSQGAIHDGNHGEECDACNVYRFAGQFCTQPWHRVVMAAREAARRRYGS